MEINSIKDWFKFDIRTKYEDSGLYIHITNPPAVLLVKHIVEDYMEKHWKKIEFAKCAIDIAKMEYKEPEFVLDRILVCLATIKRKKNEMRKSTEK